ncbi:MAG: hydrogenase maturation nickel metallochaperone HypA [Desulfuromonadaceae bacterium]|nr:hydrogenase maturation nickel metallochaperone HypA [Desulfuromonadaceae bacterium]MDD2854432.1 hydrogenase maturation nickel metallochaperone HypA [Desulfuromonadaceae bacterium]
MHEMSIVQGIVEVCEKYAAGRRILSIDLEIGELSSIVPEAIEFCFEASTRETLLDGARLNILMLNGQGKCLDCNFSFHLSELYASCQQCGSNRVQIVAGEELRVKEIEVED